MKIIAKILCFCCAFLGLHNLFASPIDSVQAAKVAKNFIIRYTGQDDNLFLVSQATNISTTTLYYVFNLQKSNAYVIVAGDDACFPILAYSTESKFVDSNLPIPLQKMLGHRKAEIAYIREKGFLASSEIQQAWQNLQNPTNVATRTEGTEGVNPLMTTKWNQSPYYNELCPRDSRANSSDGFRTVTGCVATAMAQIMKFHNFPKQGQGIYSYNHSKYGRLSADFGSTVYNWAAMPNSISSSNNAVATLMYHCGVSLDMNYGVSADGGSSASTSQVSTSLVKYFGYANTAKYVNKSSYTESNWIALLKAELNARRPMQYRGAGTGGGHSFVCDGYDDNNFLHFNWGWGGVADGFFRVTALNPGSLGTGGGDGGFNQDQGAIIGIQPIASNSNTTPVTSLQLTKKITVNPNPIGFGQDVTVTFNIANRGTTTFQGDYAVALFDSNMEFVSFIGAIASNRTLNAGFTYTTDLSFTQKSVFLSEGTYSFGAYYREPQKEWQILQQAGFENPLKVQVSNVIADLSMYGTAISVNTEPIYQKTPFEVTFNIANFKTTTFEGDLSVDLYDLEGNFVKGVELKTNLSLGSNKTFSTNLVFKSTGIDIPVGTYILAPSYKAKGSSSYFILSAYKDSKGNYPNLIRVIVAEPALIADKYEVNDSEAQAFTLATNFVSNNLVINTEGANLHTGADFDHYKLVLPAGYSYEMTARVHDSDNSGNGKTYTGDVLFSYKWNGSAFSDAFDVSIGENNSKVALASGGTLLFKVAPYFAGEKGSYLLDIQLTRIASSQPSITITSPKNGDKWQVSTNQQITWTDNITENVRIDLLKGSNNVFVQNISNSTASNGLFVWNVLSNLAEGTDYKISITSLTNANVQAISPNFSILKMVTGIEDEIFNAQIAVFPNPSKDIFTVQMPENTKITQIKLLNILGQEVLQISPQNFTQKYLIDLHTYPNGMYYIYVESNRGIGIKKIMKTL
jgi:hypothetical protein